MLHLSPWKNMPSNIYATPPLSGFESMGPVRSLKLAMECHRESKCLPSLDFLDRSYGGCDLLYAISTVHADIIEIMGRSELDM